MLNNDNQLILYPDERLILNQIGAIVKERHSLLVVEDDLDQAEELSEFLSDRGYDVDIAHDVSEFWSKFENCSYHLIILDLTFPGGDGVQITSSIRKSSNVPIIMVTGRTDPVDRVVGLEMGADDYVLKPFDMRELSARISAALRRTNSEFNSSAQQEEWWNFDSFRYHPVFQNLYDEEGQEINLTGAESALLKMFLEKPNRILSREFLTQSDLSREWDALDRSIDNLVHRLRRKLTERADLQNREIIKSKRGLGYQFVTRVTKSS